MSGTQVAFETVNQYESKDEGGKAPEVVARSKVEGGKEDC